MLQWLNSGSAESILALLVLFNMMLSALSAFFKKLSEVTGNEFEGKLAGWIVKGSDLIKKALDAIGYNPPH